MADRPPRILADGGAVDLGRGRRVRYIDTPHIPHGWDAGLIYEEGTCTLLCGGLFAQLGDAPAVTTGDIVGPAIAAEDLFRASSLNPGISEASPESAVTRRGKPQLRGSAGGGSACDSGSKGRWRRSAMN
jgi:hypothetical protein